MGRFEVTLSGVKHRLEQLTRPTFDRATVEELVNEIGRLKCRERNVVAQALAEAHNEIDRLNEAIDEYEAEAAEDRRAIALLQGQRRMVLSDDGLAVFEPAEGLPHSRLNLSRLNLVKPD